MMQYYTMQCKHKASVQRGGQAVNVGGVAVGVWHVCGPLVPRPRSSSSSMLAAWRTMAITAWLVNSHPLRSLSLNLSFRNGVM